MYLFKEPTPMAPILVPSIQIEMFNAGGRTTTAKPLHQLVSFYWLVPVDTTAVVWTWLVMFSVGV